MNMGAHIMKTTIDINDDLAREAKEVAKRQGTTLRAIIEQGIRLALEESCDQPYQLPDKSIGGGGLQKEFSDKSWGEIREAAYKYSAH